MPMCQGIHGSMQQMSRKQTTNHKNEASSRSLPSRLRPVSFIPTTEVAVSETENQSSKFLHDTFSQSQISLAITLLRSKSPNVSVEDFLNHLADNIKLEVSIPRGERRCVDTVEYWKDEYSKLVNEKRALEVEVERLKDSKTCIAVDDTVEPQGILRGNERNFLPSLRKRKVEALHSQDTNGSDDGELSKRSHKSPSHLPLSCIGLVKHAQVLDKHISDPKVPAAILLNSLSVAIHNVSEIFKRTSVETANYYPRFQLQRPFLIAASIFDLCLKGLSHLCRDIPGRSLRGRVIFNLVKLFKSVISYNKNLCATLAISEIANRKRTVLTDPPSSTINDTCVNSHYLLKERNKFLAAILTSPTYNTEQSAHLCVVEGMLAVLLKRVGELVSKSIFGEEIAASKLPGHISTLPTITVRDETDELATRLECEQMKWILRRITMPTENDGCKPGEKGSLGPPHLSMLIKGRTKHPEVHTDAVLGIAKRKVQETLLKGLFGEDGTQFRLALKIPDWDGEEEEEILRTDDDANSDFVEVVWECVGWEILDSAA